ncbi:MAG: response regulator [Pseudomonadota bacterium]
MDPRRILIVVSDRGIRESLCAMIDTTFNSHTSVAKDAETAIEILERESFDVVASEIFLPGMNGIELAEFIKNRGGPLVVLMSGFITSSNQNAAYRAGAKAFMRMPVKCEQLLKIIDQVATKNLSFITPIGRYDE